MSYNKLQSHCEMPVETVIELCDHRVDSIKAKREEEDGNFLDWYRNEKAKPNFIMRFLGAKAKTPMTREEAIKEIESEQYHPFDYPSRFGWGDMDVALKMFFLALEAKENLVKNINLTVADYDCIKRK